MKKRFLAIAIAAGLASPLAANADATVYGKVHMSIGMVEEGTTVDNWQVNNHASRLGFKGSEDLGNGLSATFKLEYSVNPDAGSGSGIGRRNQYIGLKGGFGEIRVGRHDTPLKMSQGKYDLFNDTFADIAGPGQLDISNGDNRLGNVIAYLGKASDVKYAIALIPGEGDGVTGGDGPADTISAMVAYKSGPVYDALAMDSYDDTGNTGGELEDMTRLTATYAMGKMRFGILYETEGTNGGTGEQDVMSLNFSMGMGKNKAKFQYTNGDDDTTEKTQMALGYDIGLSKRTTAYVMYADGETEVGTTTTDTTFAGVGMVHKF